MVGRPSAGESPRQHQSVDSCRPRRRAGGWIVGSVPTHPRGSACYEEGDHNPGDAVVGRILHAYRCVIEDAVVHAWDCDIDSPGDSGGGQRPQSDRRAHPVRLLLRALVRCAYCEVSWCVRLSQLTGELMNSIGDDRFRRRSSIEGKRAEDARSTRKRCVRTNRCRTEPHRLRSRRLISPREPLVRQPRWCSQPGAWRRSESHWVRAMSVGPLRHSID